MPALTTYRPWTTQTVSRTSGVRPPTVRAGVINAASAALRPLAVAAGIIAAGAALPALAHADPTTDPISAALNGTGTGNNGSFTDKIAGIGQSICPSLVKPGATIASITSQLSGKTGLPPNMAGMVAGMAIQMECPGVMTSLAHGNMPFPMQALGGMPGAGPLGGMPGAGPGMPGANPSLVGNLFPLVPPAAPGAGPAQNPLALLGH